MSQYNHNNWGRRLSYHEHFPHQDISFCQYVYRKETELEISNSTDDEAASHMRSRTFRSKRHGWIARFRKNYLGPEECQDLECSGMY